MPNEKESRGALQYLSESVEAAERSAANGGGPFAAILVTAGNKVYEGTNKVTALNDPTAHAEVQAIRNAAAVEGFNLAGSTLYSSCEPRPMCMAACMWARIDRVVWAATADQAAAGGFDDRLFWSEIQSRDFTSIQIEHVALPNAFAPFAKWQANLDRIDY